MRHKSFNSLVRIATLSFATVVALAADPKVPDNFLPANAELRRVLETPVSGVFKAAPANEVIAALCRQLPANHVYKHDTRKPTAPTFTGTFKETPLRTALFQVAKTTHVTIEWATRSDGIKIISVRD